MHAATHSSRDWLAGVHTHFDAALRSFFSRRVAQRHEIEDLTQEVYVRLGRLPAAHTPRNARAFVFATAANLLRDRFRRRAVRGEELSVEWDAPALSDAVLEPERVVAARQELDAALAVIERLKPAARHAFLHHRVFGSSHAQLAREMGVSVSMIEKHVIAALAALRPVHASGA
jgi:RNA polymerase sigma factor (sigma-70 family)